MVENASWAIEFYKKIFGAKEVMRMEKPGGKIGHAELRIGDAKIMVADACPEMDSFSPKHYKGSPVGIHLYIKDVDSIVQKAVAAGAKIIRAVDNMFYGDRSGTLEDPFGHKWSVSTHIEDVSLAQMKKRAAAMMSTNK
jgi:PhnB protein